MKKLVLVLCSAILISLFSFNPVEAQRGCCSWHGGISHCASNGRYVCNDGSYSPSCTCGAPVYYYSPTPTPILIPKSVQANWGFDYNRHGSYTVNFDWDDVIGNTGYSIGISKYAGADPGPLTDTNKSTWVFENITPGTWYVNLKAGINGYWSRVSYWTIVVPPVPTNTPTPTITPTSTITPTPTITLIPTITPVHIENSSSNYIEQFYSYIDYFLMKWKQK